MEHRCSQRLSTDIGVVICQQERLLAIGKISNATAFGFYIESDISVRPLQQLGLEVMMYRQVQKLRKFRLEAIVTHCNEKGFGVELEPLDGEQTHLLHDFISSNAKHLVSATRKTTDVGLVVNG